MDENAVLLTLGELTGLLKGLSQRVDTMHADNGLRHGQLLTAVADVQGQIHEIKHSQAGHGQEIVALDYKISAHVKAYGIDQENVKKAFDRHQEFTTAEVASLHAEILANRENTTIKFDEIFTLKNKIAGMGFIILLILGIFHEKLWGLAERLIAR